MISICRDEEGTSCCFFNPFVNIVNFQCKSVKNVIKARSLGPVPFVNFRYVLLRNVLHYDRVNFFFSSNLQFSCESIMQNRRLRSSNLCDCSFPPFKY